MSLKRWKRWHLFLLLLKADLFPLFPIGAFLLVLLEVLPVDDIMGQDTWDCVVDSEDRLDL